MISFPCAHCGKGLKVRDDLAGKKGKCPHCKQAFRVPGASIDGSAVYPESPDLPFADLRTLPPRTAVPEEDAGEPRAAGAGDTIGSPGDTAPVPVDLHDFLAPAQAADELGRLGPYRVLRVLGTGGMGVVFLAEDSLLKRTVALKAMLPALAASPSNRERFTREAQTVAAIEHDHIVSILQVGEDRGVPYLAMPYLKGEMLEKRIERQKPLPVAEVLRIGREIAEGLAAAHACGLMHRDIKPANIWLEGERRRVKILDFGLARVAGQNSLLTQQGAIIGTPAYMAPEQARGQAVDARCDLFSLGCVLYEMLTGKLPFLSSDAIATLMAVATENPEPPCELNPSVPPELSSFIMRLLAKDPTVRPRSAKAVVKEISAIQRGERKVAATHTPPVSSAGLDVEAIEEEAPELPPIAEPDDPPRDTSPTRWWPWFACAVGLLMVLILIITMIAVSAGSRPGVVTVAIDPRNVEILVDGRAVPRELIANKDIVRLEVAPGKHEMKVTKEGFEPYTVLFSVDSGDIEELRVHLEPKRESRPH